MNPNFYKSDLIKYLFISLIFLPLFSCYAENNNSRLSPVNINEIKKLLKTEKIAAFSSGDFDLDYLGELNSNSSIFKLFIYTNEFGNNRLTKRLLVFSRTDNYIGMYDIPELPTKIEKNKVVFPLEEKWGNSITFEGGSPPKKIYLDGETYSFFRGDE